MDFLKDPTIVPAWTYLGNDDVGQPASEGSAGMDPSSLLLPPSPEQKDLICQRCESYLWVTESALRQSYDKALPHRGEPAGGWHSVQRSIHGVIVTGRGFKYGDAHSLQQFGKVLKKKMV